MVRERPGAQSKSDHGGVAVSGSGASLHRRHLLDASDVAGDHGRVAGGVAGMGRWGNEGKGADMVRDGVHGGPVYLVQYANGDYDGNLAC